jgi:hypothetical protein
VTKASLNNGLLLLHSQMDSPASVINTVVTISILNRWPYCKMRFRALDKRAYFTHLKCQKRIGDDVGTSNTFLQKKNICKNMTPNALKCILLP